MKILIINSTLPVIGGVTTYANKLLDILESNGNDIKTVAVLGGSDNGFSIIGKRLTDIIKLLSKIDFIYLLIIYISRLILHLKTRMILKRFYPDIIHVQDINSCNAVQKLCKKKSIRLILTVHSHLHNSITSSRKIKENTMLSKVLLREEIKAYTNSDINIVLSDFLFKLLQSYGIESKKTIQMQNFVDTRQFYPINSELREKLRFKFGFEKNEFVICFVGRFIESKGVKILLDAFREIEDKYQDIKLTMTGYGPMNNYIKTFIKENSLNSIRIIGHLEYSEMNIPYHLSDAFIIASIGIEGSPMSVFESMSCGLPVISTEAGGLKDLLRDSDYTIKIKSSSVRDIIDAILKLYKDRELCQRLSLNAQKCVKEKYSIDNYYNKLINIYKGSQISD
jgi:glycosyltransferase involved in cell wall biosynthesis